MDTVAHSLLSSGDIQIPKPFPVNRDWVEQAFWGRPQGTNKHIHMEGGAATEQSHSALQPNQLDYIVLTDQIWHSRYYGTVVKTLMMVCASVSTHTHTHP